MSTYDFEESRGNFLECWHNRGQEYISFNQFMKNVPYTEQAL